MCWNLIYFSVKTQNLKYMHNKRHNCLERSCFVEILHACFETNFTHCQVSCVLITPPNSFVFSTNLKRKQIYIFLFSSLFFSCSHFPWLFLVGTTFLLSLLRPDARWCRARVFAYSVCKNPLNQIYVVADVTSLHRAKRHQSALRLAQGGKTRCPHGSLRIIVGMIIYVLFYSGSKYINTPVTIMASYFLFCLQS